MTKLITGAEYLPPLPEELPEEAFSKIEQHGGVKLTSELRVQVNEVAYQLVDEIEADAARSNAGEVSKRLSRLIRLLLQGSGADSSKLAAGIHDILERDAVGDALSSLLMPPCPWEPHIRTLEGHDLEKRCCALLAAASELQERLKKSYGRIFGPEPYGYVDRLIQRLDPIYRAAGGLPYCPKRGGDQQQQTPLVQFASAVATMALSTFDPKVLISEDRPAWLEPDALEERAYIVLTPTAHARRAAGPADTPQKNAASDECLAATEFHP